MSALTVLVTVLIVVPLVVVALIWAVGYDDDEYVQ